MKPKTESKSIPKAEKVPASGPEVPTGDCVDLAFDQKGFYLRSGRRDAKQAWSVKAKQRTEYQIEKRQQQRTRQQFQNAAFDVGYESD